MSVRPRTASPYPILVALGVATGELGVLFGVVPVAVGGVLLFGGGAAALTSEAGLAASTWRSLAVVGAAIGLVSLFVWGLRAGTLQLASFRAAATTDGIAVRAAIVLGAGLLLVAAGTLGTVIEAAYGDR